ncbi:TniB family NTP-binding protein [Deinococcus sp.]|uniref:TniB family NTP-binding protein n=1 Tax=Deinococcus sp. TaxID=47478 RepID=UPI0025C2D15A|nr:TniB family NTP-binding protein [Deinococcus sp.]
MGGAVGYDIAEVLQLTQERSLRDKARTLLDAPVEERLLYIREDHWIGYPAAQMVLAKLEDLYAAPDVTRPENVLIVGHTNSGKSSIVREFASRHPAQNDPHAGQAELPVIVFDAPAVPTEERLYTHLLNQLGAVTRPSEGVDGKLFRVRTLLRRLGTRVLVLDEVNNLLAANPRIQQQVLTSIKELGNDLGRPIVLTGTEVALAALRLDPQVQNRFPPVFLPRWVLNRDYLQLLASLESFLPLRKESRLASEVIAPLILEMTDGLIGEMILLVRRAATEAIRTNVECITEKLLRSLDWHSPTERNRLSAALELGAPARPS